MSIKVGMVSLGCPKNQVDAEIMLGILKNDGFVLTPDAALSDVVVVNTCGFIEDAKAESIETILEFVQLKKEGRIKSVVITGCLAERYRDEVLKEIPEADVVLGIGSNGSIADIIKKNLYSKQTVSEFGDKYELPLSGDRVVSTLPFTAYLKIAEGCSNCCTYCAIPYIRGKYRSRHMESILEEAKQLADRGITEIVLVAQDTSRYGEDIYGESKLSNLMEELAKIESFKWIRVLYCYPERIDDDLLRVMAKYDNIAKYIDIPLQHCNERILRLMNRQGDRKTLSDLIVHVRDMVPGITIRTSIIAGFPTETDDEFEELCDFVKEMQFDRLGCFAYSQEENTPAAKMDGQIDDDVKKRRAELVNELQYGINLEKMDKLMGTKQLVVVEGFDRYAECYFGRTEADAPDVDFKIFFTSKKPVGVGDYVNVKVNEMFDVDLLGEAL